MTNKTSVTKNGIILILEGVWGSGKTTLAKNLIKEYGAIFIEEPNHIKFKFENENITKITKWYFVAHEKNIKTGKIIATTKKIVIIERSPLSSIIFSELVLKKDAKVALKRFEKNLKNINEQIDQRVNIAYLAIRDLKITLKEIEKNKYLKKFVDKTLIKNLDTLLLEHLEKLEQKKLINLIKYANPNNLKNILDNFYV